MMKHLRESVQLLIVMAIIACLASSSCASEKEYVKKGNLLYNSADYALAAKQYEKAAMENSLGGIPSFNLGGALYKDGSNVKAIDAYNKAIASGKERIVQSADYNIGNALYKIGELKDKKDVDKKDIKKTAEIYLKALLYYKRAIDLDPKDSDAKFNYEFVAQKLADLKPLFQIKQEEEKKEKDKEKKDQKKKQEEKQKEGDERQQDGQQPEDKKGEDGAGGESKPDENKAQEDREKGRAGGAGEEKEDKKPEGAEEERESEGAEEEKKPEGGEGEKKPETGAAEEDREKDVKEEKAQEEKGLEPKQEEDGRLKEEEEKEAGQARREEGAEEAEKPEKKESGLAAYRGAGKQAEPGEMSAEEAKMLLEGYKGEEATGRVVRMRQKPIKEIEPAKDW